MPEVDLVRVRDLLSEINVARGRLDQLATITEAEFIKDFRNTESAKYLLIVAIEAAIDICNHLVIRKGGRAPKDYADCFTALAELDVVSLELAGRLRQMARFRNRLVHLYWEVDNRRIYEFLQEDVKDLDSFVAQVAAYLKL